MIKSANRTFLQLKVMAKKKKITNERLRQVIAFVRKRIKECDHTFKLVDEFCERAKLDPTRVKNRLKPLGGTCDCQTVSRVPQKLNEIEETEREQRKIQQAEQREKEMQAFRERIEYWSPLEKDFEEWLLNNKTNSGVGVLVEVCVNYMDKPFYEWVSDGCTYDYSGVLRQTNSTIKDRCLTFKELMEAHTGNSTATGISHYGLHYDDIEDECHTLLNEKIFGEYLSEYIKEKREWLLSFDKLVKGIKEEDFWFDADTSEDEKIRIYLNMEDLLGYANISLECKVEEIAEVLEEELYEQVRQIYSQKISNLR